MKTGSLFLFFFIIYLFSCNEDNSENYDSSLDANISAELFKIEKIDNYKKLSVFNKQGNVIDEYFLIDQSVEIPKAIKNSQIIRVPVNNVITLSTTHTSFINQLGNQSKIVGVSGINLIYDEVLKERIRNGDVKDVGYESSLDFELLISLKPDLVSIYDINGTLQPIINKLKKFNIPVVQVNEYLESSPLAQAEWLIFFAEFFNQSSEAKKIFNEIYTNYNNLKIMTDTVCNRPKVLLNLPWKGTWYIPGGNSNIAQLIRDAGGDYIWSNSEEKHNIPLSIEDVYFKASKADIWLNTGQTNSMKDVYAVDDRLSDFKPWKKNCIYNRNKRVNETGSNDYMESGTVRPDLILKDLISILQPHLFPDHNLYYYTKLQ